MVVLFLTIPLMVLGLVVALGPLVFAMVRDRRVQATPEATPASAAPVGHRLADDEGASRREEGVLVGV